jgi:hypothetical protein
MKRYRAGKIRGSVGIAAGVVASALLFTAISPSLVAAPLGILVLMLGLVIWIPLHEYRGWISAGVLGSALFIAGSGLPQVYAFSMPAGTYLGLDLAVAIQEVLVSGLAGGLLGSTLWLIAYRRAPSVGRDSGSDE